MYVWIGCKLPEDFADGLRQVCTAQNRDLGLDASGFHLPQHISLKITFDAGQRWQEILDRLEGWLQTKEKFYVNLNSPELVPGVLWLPVTKNAYLTALHRDLDSLLQADFGIGQHPFDKDFRFHTTLFQGDGEGMQMMHRRLAELRFSMPLPVDTFLLGVSEDNTRGSYRIVREIHL